MNLASLSLTDWAVIIAAVWLILACAGVIPIGRLFALAHRGTTTADRDDDVEWSPFLPPVPPPARPAPFWTAEVSADFLLDDDPELERRFFAVMDRHPELHERLINIVSEWEWSE
ncbi:MAG: hypothetical protein JWO98_4896 [Frankiales bacterium]|nr:hypothetical protein [Frankiales bacterium]